MEWIFNDDTNCWVCGECGFDLYGFDDPDYPPEDIDYYYCPHCGTKLGDSRSEQFGEVD